MGHGCPVASAERALELGAAFGVSTTRGYRLTDLGGHLLNERLTENPVADPVDHQEQPVRAIAKMQRRRLAGCAPGRQRMCGGVA